MEINLSGKASAILVLGKEEADRLQNPGIAPEHIMLGIMRDGENRAMELLRSLKTDFQQLRTRLESQLRMPSADAKTVSFNNIKLTETSSRLIRISMLEARMLKADAVEPEHLLLAILRDNRSFASQALLEQDVDYRRVLELITYKQDTRMGLGYTDEDEEDDDIPSSAGASSGQPGHQETDSTVRTRSARKSGNGGTPVLDSFSTDITKAAEDGTLDPVVGREREIERLAQILSRRKKNNPVLIGEPGVGKTAIVEGLAERIVNRQVPHILLGKRIISLDMASVVAGTKYRGQFEERLRSIIKELSSNKDIILYIDEIHTIVGAGSAPGTMDAANMLKPALSRGEIQCIGSTTTDEYRKSIEKDGALERRFQKILVESPTEAETLEILKNLKPRYEDHHNVTYTDAALEACVRYAARYITDRSFPDKAIDLMDEAGSRTHLFNISVPAPIENQEKQIADIKAQKVQAAANQDFEAAARLRDEESQLNSELVLMKKEWNEQQRSERELVDEQQIAQTASTISGIPVQKIASEEGVRLKGLAASLKSRVIAQDKAIDTLVKAVQRGRVGLKNPDRPIGSFLFLGPTGVGKTLLAKELAIQMFGSADALIRVDMSEFMEKFTVSRLVGAPPGYVGYDEGGELTEKVRRKPYSIILLDEIEKAHQDVYNMLLQVMDEGRLTDSNGRTVDFRNTVIIMTSNIGSRQVKDFGHGIGFGLTVDSQSALEQEIVRKALNKSFAPEFINRIDEIISFSSLGGDDLKRIVKLETDALSARLLQLGYGFEITDAATSFLASKGSDAEYGARPLKRAVQTYIEDPVSGLMIEEQCSLGDTIVVDYIEGSAELSVTASHVELS